MQTLSLIPLAVIPLFAAVYAHLRLPALCHTAGSLLLGRVLLIGTGIGFGLAMVGSARVLAGETGWLDDILVFLGGFGVVHVPAALIMVIKLMRRREGAGPQEPDDWP
jgi:hypothetical protein